MKKITAEQARNLNKAHNEGTAHKIGRVFDPKEVKIIVTKLLDRVEPAAEKGITSCCVSVGGYSAVPLKSGFEKRFEATGEEVKRQLSDLGFTATTWISEGNAWTQPEDEFVFKIGWGTA